MSKIRIWTLKRSKAKDEDKGKSKGKEQEAKDQPKEETQSSETKKAKPKTNANANVKAEVSKKAISATASERPSSEEVQNYPALKQTLEAILMASSNPMTEEQLLACFEENE